MLLIMPFSVKHGPGPLLAYRAGAAPSPPAPADPLPSAARSHYYGPPPHLAESRDASLRNQMQSA